MRPLSSDKMMKSLLTISVLIAISSRAFVWADNNKAADTSNTNGTIEASKASNASTATAPATNNTPAVTYKRDE